ncbi:GntR family transcriptional regulator [Pseudalkalibacillus sp. A8]|uniref:GntR family transcriptional regulator n=1 Tax=Pseudalkalibacillus sp. A8 TaxID=3382641 RepID=UPI0038B59513
MMDKNSPLPLYHQLEEHIKSLIEKGELKPEDSLPSEREYAEKYDISRMTVRQAINNLVKEGYLYRRKGKGSFVSEQKIEQKLIGLTSFTEDMRARGMEPSSRLLHFEIIPANIQVAKQLGIKEYAPVYEIRRIRLADNVPMALETNYISANLIKGLTEEIVSQSLYQYIEEKQQLTIDYSTQIIESSIAGQKESDALAIEKGAPILFIRRNTYLKNGVPFEMVKSAYRADRYKFTINIKR